MLVGLNQHEGQHETSNYQKLYQHTNYKSSFGTPEELVDLLIMTTKQNTSFDSEGNETPSPSTKMPGL